MFFKLKKVTPYTFSFVEPDLIAVQNMGKLIDNSLNDTPMVLFDTNKFKALQYRNTHKTFVELFLVDVEHNAETFPKAIHKYMLVKTNHLCYCAASSKLVKRINAPAIQPIFI